MKNLSRRNFLRTVPLAAGAASLGTLSACADPQATTGNLSRRSPLDGVSREPLKITDVKVTLMSYALPRDKQWVSAVFLVPKTDCCLIEVFTDQGIVGIGEASPYGGMVEMKRFIESYLKPALVGANPFDIDLLTAGGTTFMKACAYGGINVALWDIIGKAKGLPVYQLLAVDTQPETHIRMYASSGVEYAWYDRPEALVDQALRHKEVGYTAMKYRIGTDWAASGVTVDRFATLIRKVREAVGDDFDLMNENNMRLNLQQCLELAPVWEELNMLWLEEPVNRRTEQAIEEHQQIQAALPTVKVSGGETMFNRFEFKEWIDRDAYAIVQPDCNTTGITEAWYVAQMGHLRGKPCCPHNWHGGLTTMANAHLVAAIPNRLMLELNQTYNPFKEEIFKDPLVVVNGYMDLPDRPGFGMELIDDVASKFPYIDGSWAVPNPNLPK